MGQIDLQDFDPRPRSTSCDGQYYVGYAYHAPYQEKGGILLIILMEILSAIEPGLIHLTPRLPQRTGGVMLMQILYNVLKRLLFVISSMPSLHHSNIVLVGWPTSKRPLPTELTQLEEKIDFPSFLSIITRTHRLLSNAQQTKKHRGGCISPTTPNSPSNH